MDSTKESKEKQYVGEHAPVERERREKGKYSNVEKEKEFKEGRTKYELINLAIAKKIIWDGDRKNIHWSTGFSDDWWKDQLWVCSHQFPKFCNVIKAADDHSQLEIGHIKGFYTIMSNLDPKTVCDGTNHWTVYLVEDVIKKNEDLDNLEPQCSGCNRHPSQQKKDDRGLGKFNPEILEACPGNDECDAQYKIDHDGDLNG